MRRHSRWLRFTFGVVLALGCIPYGCALTKKSSPEAMGGQAGAPEGGASDAAGGLPAQGGAAGASAETAGGAAGDLSTPGGGGVGEAPGSCDDGQKDGDETDVDCGGGCAPCSAEQSCDAPADCESGVCQGTCRPAKTASFGKGQDYVVPSQAWDVALVDLDQNDALDIVLPHLSSHVTILRGLGDGTFQPAKTVAAGVGANSVAALDFDGNGFLDLAVTHETGTLSLLDGYGDGINFDITKLTIDPPQDLAAGFLDADSDADLVVCNNLGNAVDVYLGNGMGAFTTASYPTVELPYGVAIGDVDEDSNLDLVVAGPGFEQPGGVSVLLGNGDGSYKDAENYPAGTGSSHVALADFNADGHLDVAVANFDSRNVSVLIGAGDGTLQPATSYHTGSGGSIVAAADLNLDGVLDLAEANEGSDNIGILLGKGDGTFEKATYILTAPGPRAVALADLNGDDRADLVIAYSGSAYVSVLINTGS